VSIGTIAGNDQTLPGSQYKRDPQEESCKLYFIAARRFRRRVRLETLEACGNHQAQAAPCEAVLDLPSPFPQIQTPWLAAGSPHNRLRLMVRTP
jgi:hypothetical protein